MWPTVVCLDGIQKESLILLPSKRHLGDVVNLVFCRVKIVENSNTGHTGHMSKLQDCIKQGFLESTVDVKLVNRLSDCQTVILK